MTETRWVKPNESLPKDDQDCWVCKTNNEVVKASFDVEVAMDEDCNFVDTFYVNEWESRIHLKDVRAWTPYYTPEPPRDL